MNLNGYSTGNTILRLFDDGKSQASEEEAIFQQLPFLDSLTEQFETVTGWKIAFNETSASFRNRESFGEDETVFGDLQISDLSAKLEAGKSARHRGYCEQLVEILDSMIHIIQADRERFVRVGTQLTPTVDLPFDWMGMEGNSGFSKGQFSGWSITSEEKVRVFIGKLNSPDSIESAFASTIVLSSFEMACQNSLPLHAIAPLLPEILRQSSTVNSNLSWFAILEIDPITGEYEIDGFNAEQGVSLVDVEAGALVASMDMSGVLYPGQLLCLG
ncbi:MAG: hypothetical protein AAGA30_19960, partial [Planctomycetota bacterium]